MMEYKRIHICKCAGCKEMQTASVKGGDFYLSM